LHPMHTDVSVKNPIRGGWSGYPERAAGSSPPAASAGPLAKGPPLCVLTLKAGFLSDQ
jgi:hypothetical protein